MNMRVRHIIIIVAVLVLFAWSTTSASATDAGGVCKNGEGDRLYVLFPDGTSLSPSDTASVYPGTELRLVRCQESKKVSPDDDGGEGWRPTIEAKPLTEEESYQVVVPAPSEADGWSIDSSVVKGGGDGISAPNVVITRDHLTKLSVEPTTDGETRWIQFGSATTRKTFENHRNTYFNSTQTISNATANTDWRDPNSIEDTLEVVNKSHELNDTHRALDRTLFAASANGSTSAIEAMRIVDRYHESRIEELRNATAEGRNVAKEASEAVLIRFSSVFVLGGVFGAAGGWFVTRRKMEDVQYWRSRTSSVDYEFRQIARELTVAVVLLLLGVAVLYATQIDGVMAAFEVMIRP